MNILYICTPSSIHDQKWMRFFAEKESFRVFAVGESNYTQDSFEELKKQNIVLLPAIDSFSIKTPLSNYKSIRKLRHYCEEYQIDLIHVLFATPYALWVNYISTPYIITTRGSDVLVVIPELMTPPLSRRIYFNWLFKRFEKAFKNAQQVTSTSDLQQSKIAEIFQVEATVIRTGVEVDQIRELVVEYNLPYDLIKKKFVFSPRFMSDIYNISYQIDAIALLSKEIINEYTFVFIKGKKFNRNYFEEQHERLRQLKESRGLDFLILDFLTQKELWATFKSASLTIMTPKSDGTPNSALEAMVAQSPLIVSDLPYDKSLFDNTCEKVRLDNPKYLANLIERTLISPPSKEFLMQVSNNVKTNGNRQIEMRKLEELYKANIEDIAMRIE